MDLPRPEPFDAVTEHWEGNPDTDLVGWLEDDSLWIATEDGWTYADTSRTAKYVLTVSDSGAVTVSRVFEGAYRYLLYGLLLVSPAALLYPSALTALLYPLVASYSISYNPASLSGLPARRVSHRIHPLLAILYIVGMLALGLYIVELVSAGLWEIVFLLILGSYALSILYSRNALPSQSESQAAYVLRIPLSLSRTAFLTLGILFGVTIVSARVVTFFREALELPTKHTAAVASQLTAGSVQELGGEIFELIWQVVQFAPVGLSIGGLYIALLFSRSTLSELRRIADFLDQTSADAERDYLVLGGLYCSWGGLVVVGTLLIVGVLWFGITGIWPYPETVLDPVATLLPQSVGQSHGALLTAMFDILDTTFQGVPWIQARTVSIGVLALVFAPTLLICLSFIGHVVAFPLTLAVRLVRSEPIAASNQTLPIVRVSPSTSAPLQPIRLFGYTLCLFISPTISEQCDAAQIETLVERVDRTGTSRSLPMRVLASLVVLIPGGRNLSSVIFPPIDQRRLPDFLDGTPTSMDSDSQGESTSRSLSQNSEIIHTIEPLAQWLERYFLLPMSLYYGSPRVRTELPLSSDCDYSESGVDSRFNRSSKDG